MTSQQDVPQIDVSSSDDETEVTAPVVFGEFGTDPVAVNQLTDLIDGIETSDGFLTVTPEDIAERGQDGLLEEFQSHPAELIHHLTRTVRERENKDIDVNFSGELPGDAHTCLENLRAADVGSLVSVECSVVDRTEVFGRRVKAVFDCVKCSSSTMKRRQSRCAGDLEYPRECASMECDNSSVKWMEHLAQQDDIVDRQQIILQDLHANSSTPTPSEFRADLNNRFVNSVESGETVTITAIVRATEDDEKNSEHYLQVVGIEHHDRSYSGIELDDDDIERHEGIAASDDVFEILSESIAPSIKGDYGLAKKAGLYQLAGGVRRQTAEQDERENIHVAYVGDPGTGKSDIGEYIAQIAPKSVYQSADNATQVGLTASISYEDKFDNTQATLTGGVFVRADGGIAVIDELDKGSDAVRNCLQEPLERQEVSVAKHDIKANLPTRCGALLIANPDNSRFDLATPLKQQIALNDVVWDRMDIIVPFLNKPDEDRDNEIAESVLNRAKGETEECLPRERMTKYVAHARSIDPEMTDAAGDIIHEWWVDLRTGGNEFRTPVGIRQLNSAVRIAEASARLRLSDTVEEDDAERATQMMGTWMSLMMTNERGQFDVDVLSGESAPTREKIVVLREVIRDLADDDGGADRSEVVENALDDLDEDRNDFQQFVNAKIGNPGESGVKQEDGKLFTGDFD